MSRFSHFILRTGCGTAALLFGIMAASRATAACSCDARRQVRLLKEGNQPLPRNPQLRIRMGRDGVAVPWSQPGTALPRPEDLRLAIVDKQSGRELPVNERRVPAGWGLMALVSPKEPLQAGTQYEVVVAQDKQRAKLGEFQTTASEDHSPPVFAGVQSHKYTPPLVPPPDSALCDNGREYIELQVTPPQDDQAQSALYLVWLAPKDGHIDFAAPPSHAQILRPTDRTVQVGSRSKCNAEGLSWAARPWQMEQRVGLIVYDEAGNASQPVERVIPLSAPVTW